jgi:hypothetical protein
VLHLGDLELARMPISLIAALEDLPMSSISSLSGGIAQFIQNLNPSGAVPASSNTSSGATTAATGHPHHHGGGFAKLADAIESALQSASNGSSGSTTTDPNQTITQALTKIFQNGSLDSTSETDGSNSAAQPSTTGTTSATTGSLPADFVQTLKSFGVTPQQFQADLATALKTAQDSGNFDPTSVLKNFPPGSVVDTLA